jgi:iron(III) transport system substrate-binding protein
MRRVHPLSHTRLSECRGQSNPDPKLVEGAKKEGQMIFYTTMTLDQSKEVVDRFQKKYPFIKPTLFRTGGGPFLNTIFTEARGGRHAWDVVVGRAEMVVPLIQRKLMRPTAHLKPR